MPRIVGFSSFIIFSDDPWSLLVSFCQLFKLPLVVQCCDVICEWPLNSPTSVCVSVSGPGAGGYSLESNVHSQPDLVSNRRNKLLKTEFWGKFLLYIVLFKILLSQQKYLTC